MRYSLLAVHLGVLGAVVALVVSFNLAPMAIVAGLLIAAGPLVLATRGLWAESPYTHQWLSIAMVFYVGFGLVETIASRAQSLGAVVLLLTSGVELALLFIALRRARRASRGSVG